MKGHYLPRSIFEPPDFLLKQVFPGLENSYLQLKDVLSDGTRLTEHAGTGFLQLMTLLRKVILQDAALLMEMV